MTIDQQTLDKLTELSKTFSIQEIFESRDVRRLIQNRSIETLHSQLQQFNSMESDLETMNKKFEEFVLEIKQFEDNIKVTIEETDHSVFQARKLAAER